MASEYDIILPNWWLNEHPIKSRAFTYAKCREQCTKDKHNSMYEWDASVLENKNAGLLGMVCAAPTEDELQQAINQVPDKFAKFIPIMTTEAAMKLPKHSHYDHEIIFKEGTTPPSGPIYALNETELEELRKFLKRMTEMGAVRPSKSSCSSPMLFVPKGHGRGLRLCIDYRGINKITIPNRYPLPNMDELRERVRGKKWFTKLDLKNGYHLIRMKAGVSLFHILKRRLPVAR